MFVPFSFTIHAIATKYSSMSSSDCHEVPIIVKIPVIWDAMPCALAYRYQYFGGACCLQQAFLDYSEMLVSTYQSVWCHTYSGTLESLSALL